jgi:hypothetical protein
MNSNKKLVGLKFALRDRSAYDCLEVHPRTFPEAANQSGQHQRTRGSMGVQLETGVSSTCMACGHCHLHMRRWYAWPMFQQVWYRVWYRSNPRRCSMGLGQRREGCYPAQVAQHRVWSAGSSSHGAAGPLQGMHGMMRGCAVLSSPITTCMPLFHTRLRTRASCGLATSRLAAPCHAPTGAKMASARDRVFQAICKVLEESSDKSEQEELGKLLSQIDLVPDKRLSKVGAGWPKPAILGFVRTEVDKALAGG